MDNQVLAIDVIRVVEGCASADAGLAAYASINEHCYRAAYTICARYMGRVSASTRKYKATLTQSKPNERPSKRV